MQVRVFYNLTRKCWSIQHRVPGKGWRLHSHASVVSVADAKPVVLEGGRRRTLREGKRYVHAFITGRLTEHHLRRGFTVSYNPHKGSGFFYRGGPLREHGAPFEGAWLVTMTEDHRVLAAS